MTLSLRAERHPNGGVAVSGVALDGEGAESVAGYYEERERTLVLDRNVWWSFSPLGTLGTTARVRFVGIAGARAIAGVWGPPGSLPGPADAAREATERGDTWGGTFVLVPRLPG